MAEFNLLILALAWILGIVLLIGWILLPFAVIGTKPILEALLREQRRTNELLEKAHLRDSQ
jgi:hypothetical protein